MYDNRMYDNRMYDNRMYASFLHNISKAF